MSDFPPPNEPTNPYESSYSGAGQSQPPMTGSPQRSSIAIWFGIGSLIASFMGFFSICCGLALVFPLASIGTGIFAVIQGRKELAAVDQGYMAPNQRGPAMTGVVTGAIGLTLSVLMVVGSVALIVFAIAISPDNPNRPF